MITKAVGTGDLEIESSSVSTDSGSPVTDGNNGKVSRAAPIMINLIQLLEIDGFQFSSRFKGRNIDNK